MIPGAALADWLADRDAQRRSFDKVDAFAQKWGTQPLMTQLERAVSELQPRTAKGLLAIARRFMDKGAEIETMMRELIATSSLDPFFRPPFHPLTSEVQSSLLLYHHPDLSISLGVTGVDMLAAKKSGRTAPASVNFTGYFSLLRFLKAGGATLSFWEAPPIEDSFDAASAGSCRMVERRRIADGEEVVIDGRYQSFVIEHATSDILIFQAVARAGCAPVGTEYDYDSRRFIGASSTDEASSRLQMMVSLLRAMDREDAFPLLEEALQAPQFYTRWYVMREMLAMDAEAALPSLRRLAAADPHPDVRTAAQQALDLFFPDVGQAEGAAQCRA
ncbi:MAG: HEAT repeat domain-containing protein [Pseudomonadota bacterium]|nr:HEAT repeat domain-containing protein [Pseudomonadota bacterium]